MNNINTPEIGTVLFNTNMDELPFDILSLIISFVFPFSSFPACETRNFSMISKKMNSTITQCRLPRWDEEQDRVKLLSLLQKLLAMPVKKAEQVYEKYYDHFPFTRFASFENLLKYALINILHKEHTNRWINYLINKQFQTGNVVISTTYSKALLLTVGENYGDIEWSWYSPNILEYLLSMTLSGPKLTAHQFNSGITNLHKNGSFEQQKVVYQFFYKFIRYLMLENIKMQMEFDMAEHQHVFIEKVASINIEYMDKLAQDYKKTYYNRKSEIVRFEKIILMFRKEQLLNDFGIVLPKKPVSLIVLFPVFDDTPEHLSNAPMWPVFSVENFMSVE